jgi:hypothetical protein
MTKQPEVQLLGRWKHRSTRGTWRRLWEDDGQARNNPSGTKAGFTNGWIGIVGEIRAPAPENLLVKWRGHAGCGLNMSTVCFL